MMTVVTRVPSFIYAFHSITPVGRRQEMMLTYQKNKYVDMLLYQQRVSFPVAGESQRQSYELYATTKTTSSEETTTTEIVKGEPSSSPSSYGLSTSVERILKEVVYPMKQGPGYYRAVATEQVMKVVDQITRGREKGDVALVYQEEKKELEEEEKETTESSLLGIFTESDYINVCSFFFLLYFHSNIYIYISSTHFLFFIFFKTLTWMYTLFFWYIVFNTTCQGINI